MSTKATPRSAVHVDALVGRLRAHAEAHEYIANADPEQKQWMNDLYDAADEIERLRGLVARALALCGSVAEQQAVPDDSWEEEAAAILRDLEKRSG